MSEILAAGPARWGCDPYAWDFECAIRMTPIEAMMWFDIRHLGMVLYPQCPVDRYFVDYANPVARVAIECDGAAYHLDVERDRDRQAQIEALGWTVYRFTGRTCLSSDQEGEDEQGNWCWTPNECFTRLKVIGDKHGIRLGCKSHALHDGDVSARAARARLNQVRDGAPANVVEITDALRATGDIPAPDHL
jgi:hypothetical protein